ncbi:MAG: Uma2 family endonuclease [Gemmataceae bacterium]
MMNQPVQTIAPLREGERLSREEFERRYQAMPQVKKAELIDGVVHMPSPVRILSHATPHLVLGTWLGVYYSQTPGTLAACEPTTRLDEANEPQPDGLLMRTHGGTAEIDSEDYVCGSPELLAEIAASSGAIDRGAKRRNYERNGVQEYVLLLMEEQRAEWHALRNGTYELLPADEAGIVRSEVFPGLWLDTRAFFALNVAQVLATLQQGLASAEHAAFVARLQGLGA